MRRQTWGSRRGRLFGAATFAVAVALAQTVSAGATLDRIRQTGKLALGYRADAPPFSYRDQAGKPAGYSVALCQKIANAVKTELGLSSLRVEWVPVTLADRFDDLKQGKVDLLCGAASKTLARMKEISFSIPIFEGGIGALLRADAPPPLPELLAGAPPPSHPIWRGSPARTFLEKKTFSVVAGTTSESWLAERLAAFQIAAGVAVVPNYEAGIRRVLDRRSDVLFGDRALLLEAAKRDTSGDLIVLDRLFTYEAVALAFGRDDEDFGLIVDRTLSRLYGSPDFRDLYAKWFGKPDAAAVTFFRLNKLPE